MKPALISHHTHNKKEKESWCWHLSSLSKTTASYSYTHPSWVELSLFIAGVEKWKRQADYGRLFCKKEKDKEEP